MEEGGGGEEKGRPDTKPFRKSCDTSKITQYSLTSPTQVNTTTTTTTKYGQSDRQGEAIEIFHRCFDFMSPVCDTFMDRDAERNSKRL